MQKEKVMRGCSFLSSDSNPQAQFTPEDFTDEHKMIAKTTEEFIENEVEPVIDCLEQQDFDESVRLLREAGNLGLLSADIPEKYGGLELDKISSSLIVEKFFRVGGFALSHSGHIGIGSLPIVYFGNEEQKKKYLPKLATGEWLAAYALTEPGAGTDALGAKTSARLNEEGTHYILNGEKQWITNSHFADVFIVYAKIDNEHFSAFIVERDYPGVSVGPEEKKMGMHSSSTRTLILDNVEVPVENLLGEKGRGHIIAFNILNFGRIKLAIGTVGGAKRALQLATSYVNQREQFNQALSQFTLTQEKLATMASQIYVNESAVYKTIGLLDQSMEQIPEEDFSDPNKVAKAIAEYQVECSLNKFMCTEMLDYVVDEALQLHGGYGFMQEYEIERMYRDSRINRIFEGTNEINRMLVPSTVVKRSLQEEIDVLSKAKEIVENQTSELREIKDGVLEREKELLNRAKKITLLTLHHTVETYKEALAKEQEVVASLANMIAEVYNMESAYARTSKAVESVGKEKSRLKILYTEVYVQEAFERIEQEAKKIVVTLADDEETIRRLIIQIKELTNIIPVNVVHKKREIAKEIINEERYVV